MKKAALWILILAVLVAAAASLLPRSTRIAQTLNAVKLYSNGKELGTIQIPMQGYMRNYLFCKDRLDITITSFDDYSSIKVSTDGNSNLKGVIINSGAVNYLSVGFSAWSKSSDSLVFAELRFSPDLEYWCFFDKTNEVYFVASSHGHAALQELCDYFNVPVYEGKD